MTVQVKRDGEIQSTFDTGDAVKNTNQAWVWVLKHQPMSVDWALRYEGWEITDDDGKVNHDQ
jgi:hypothetical protein